MPHVDVRLALGGRDLDPQCRVDWLRLEMSLEGHPAAQIRLVSTDKSESGAARSARLDKVAGALAEKATLQLVPGGGGYPTLIFKALVTGATHERELDGDHAVVLDLLAPTILLDAGPRCRTWENKDPQAIAKSVVAGAAALSSELGDLPTAALPYEAQFEETDFEFLRRIAGRSAVWLYYDGQKLRAAKHLPEPGQPSLLSVQRGKEAARLQSLSVTSRMVASRFFENQFLQEGKEDVSASHDDGSSEPVSHPLLRLARDGSMQHYSAPVHPHPLGEVRDGPGLKDLARNRYRSWLRSLVLARASTDRPGIRPGQAVTVQGAAGVEDAEYLVVAATHEYARQAGYQCRLTMVPVDAAWPPVRPPAAATSLHRAVVVGAYDKDHPGMVRVRYSRALEEPGGNGTPKDTTWVRVAVPHGGETGGWVALPEVGDEVIVGHVGGRASHPVILGSVYSTGKKSPALAEVEPELQNNDAKLLLTKSGNKILLVDAQGKEEILVSSPEGKNLLRMTLDGGPFIHLITEGDVSVKAEKTVTVKAGGDMTLEAGGKLVLKAQGDVEMTSQANVTGEATGNLELAAGGNLSGKATGNLELEGMTLKAVGSTQAELSGASTSVKGQAQVEIKGALVRIN